MKKLIEARQIHRDLRHAIEHIESSCILIKQGYIGNVSVIKAELGLARNILRKSISRELRMKRKGDKHETWTLSVPKR